MSQDNNVSWKSILSSVVNKVAEVNLNPAAAIKHVVDDKKSRPMPLGLKQAKEALSSAEAEVKRAKMLAKVAKKADWYR